MNPKDLLDYMSSKIDCSPKERISWNEYFSMMSILVSLRSTCIRRKVGAVIVKDKNVLATGYNGVPTGICHCIERGCLRNRLNIPSGERHELCAGLHAEQNAIIQCAKHGVSLNGATLYCTTYPCSICAKIIINAGITQVLYLGDYNDPQAKTLFDEAGVGVRQVTI